MKSVLITGGAGFVGFHVATALHKRGDRVVVIDNFNDYYDPALKRERAAQLDLPVIEMDVCDLEGLKRLFKQHEFTDVIHLAAQAGVRYAQQHPEAYLHSNLDGFLQLLEVLKKYPATNLIYASSSSVYGANEKVPFSIEDDVSKPANLYAATKRANELMAYSYHHLYGIKMVGLRYFTVYGPWGRPDMAYFSFTNKILNNIPITLFNNGNMSRDFTYIDDIVAGTVAAMDHACDYELFNLGNNSSVELRTFVHTLEELLGKKGVIESIEEAPGEMIKTYADIDASIEKLGYQPKVSLKEGLSRFVAWYEKYREERV